MRKDETIMCYDELAADIYIEGQEARIAELEREVFQLRQRRYWPHTVTELCPHCTNEIKMCWNTGEYGYKAFCPVCGKRLMLCDDCRHTDGIGDCDYDSESDTCRFNCREESDNTVSEKESKNRLVIVVRDGMVSGVFATYAKESVEIIDCDTDDTGLARQALHRLDEVKADCSAGKLIEYQ